ncbi:MAG: 16S rRNA (uracil(1498)-N(3))-methyltransferase [Eubacteriales bacterium]|nr:16S rRNA (uracil(1498)-N(3))-methyltransferase [Eubacteriales bacterium]
MYHFFVEPSQVGEHEIQIIGSDVNHIKNVLRMLPGEKISVSTGEDGFDFLCEIETLDGKEIRARILEKRGSETELPCRITLFQGLPKSDKMELIIQKAVELGVYRIVPVTTRRTIVKLDAKKEAAKQKRWQQIAESAAKQSGRAVIPEVSSVHSWKEALKEAAGLDVRVIPYELATGMEATREIFSQIRSGQSVAIFIGPEGGFEEEEIAQAREEAGFSPITLGRRILRTETAGLATLAMLVYTVDT